jgi:phage shock protein PspC (stress-responsive transcriptional regulator)
MTETEFGTTFTSPRLERPAEAPLAGVSLALARTTGTDVVLWRVLFVVLTVFGGLGIALYLACYVAIPSEREEHSLVFRVLHGPDRRVSKRQLLLLALVVVVTLGALKNVDGWLVALGFVGIGYLWWRNRDPRREAHPPAVLAEPPSAAVPGPALAVSPPRTENAGPVWQPPAQRTRSVLTALTLSSAALVVGVLLLLTAAGTASLATEVVLAAALGVVGLGLVVSAWWGRARGLVPVAVLLALALGGTVAARPAIDHGVGERDWVARSAGTFRLGVGDATLTLASPAGSGVAAQEVVAHVSYGHLKVLVPSGIRAVVDVRVQTGDVQADGGVDDNGRGVHRTFVLGPEGSPQVHVDASVGVGMVEVRGA